MSGLSDQYLDALRIFSTELEDQPVPWAITGSTSFVLQGVPLNPNDIDIQTTKDGAYTIEECFIDQSIDPISFSESEAIRSHFGALELNSVRVEVMGALQKRRADGAWESPIDITEYRTFVDVGEFCIPVLSLQYEAKAYEQLGRSERAALLSEYIDS